MFPVAILLVEAALDLLNYFCSRRISEGFTHSVSLAPVAGRAHVAVGKNRRLQD